MLAQANIRQAEAIQRYYRRRQRLGDVRTLEEVAREWVHRYARYWRYHYTMRSATVV